MVQICKKKKNYRPRYVEKGKFKKRKRGNNKTGQRKIMINYIRGLNYNDKHFNS